MSEEETIQSWLNAMELARKIEKDKEIERLKGIIKEAREYIVQYGNLYCLKHTQFKNYHQYKVILEILDKGCISKYN